MSTSNIFTVQLPDGWRAAINQAAAQEHLYAADIVRRAIARDLTLEPPLVARATVPRARRDVRFSIDAEVDELLRALRHHEGRPQGRIIEQALRDYYAKTRQ